MVAVTDFIVVHPPTVCSCCNRAILAEKYTLSSLKRQVFDIPIPRLEVTEHRLSCFTCCGTTHYGQFPEKVTANMQYGIKILT